MYIANAVGIYYVPEWTGLLLKDVDRLYHLEAKARGSL